MNDKDAKETLERFLDENVDLMWEKFIENLEFESQYGGTFIRLTFPEKQDKLDRVKYEWSIIK